MFSTDVDYEIVNFDTAVFNVISSIRNNNLTNLFKFITAFGSAEVLVLIFILSLHIQIQSSKE